MFLKLCFALVYLSCLCKSISGFRNTYSRLTGRLVKPLTSRNGHNKAWVGRCEKELGVALAEGSGNGAVTEQGPFADSSWPGPTGRAACLVHATCGSPGRLSTCPPSFPQAAVKATPGACISVVLQTSLGRKKGFNLLIISTRPFHLCTCDMWLVFQRSVSGEG